MKRRTSVDIEGEDFHINGQVTYPGRYFKNRRVEGLLFNTRLVQGIFDDLNPDTRSLWDYPDGPWDPERNTDEFVAAMPCWRGAGLLSFTLNLQGGNPQGYGKNQPWHNSAFTEKGQLRTDYIARLKRILEKADILGMVVILGCFYQAQDQRLLDNETVVQALDNVTQWLLEQGYHNVMIEIGNEVDHPGFTHPIISASRTAELIRRVQERSAGRLKTQAGRLLVSTSFCGGKIANESIARSADFLLLHGNGVDVERIREMVDQCRTAPGYNVQPIVFNEDDAFDFDRPQNHMLAALDKHASWGYFDYRMAGEGYYDGYQSIPVDWQIRSPRKCAFFDLLQQVTGCGPDDSVPL